MGDDPHGLLTSWAHLRSLSLQGLFFLSSTNQFPWVSTWETAISCAGVQDFLESVPSSTSISFLASTCSATSEGLVEAALAALGPALSDRCRIFQAPSAQSGAPQADDPDAADFSNIEIGLQAATAQVSLHCWTSPAPLIAPCTLYYDL
jgi:hypothetical protein